MRRWNERRVDDVVIIDVAGRLTLDVGDVRLRRHVTELLERGERKILLNLDEVSYMDSAGFGALHACNLSAADDGASLKLLNVPTKVRQLLKFADLLELFEHFSDETEAARSFAS